MKNLSFNATEDDIIQFFSDCGKIEKIVNELKPINTNKTEV